MKTTIKQLTGLLLVFAFLTVAGTNLPHDVTAANDTAKVASDSADSISDSISDSVTDTTRDTSVSDTSSSDTAVADTLPDTTKIATDDTTSGAINDTGNDTTGGDTITQSSALAADSTVDTATITARDSIADSTSDTITELDSAETSAPTEPTDAQDIAAPKNKPVLPVADSTVADSTVTLSPREQAEQHYQAALDYAKDPTKNIEMMSELTLAIQSDPKFAPPYFKLGIYHYQNRNYKEAEDKLKKAAELSPNDTTTLNTLAKLYVALRKRDEAEKTFLAAIAADKNFIGGYRELGDLYYREKRYEESITALAKYNKKVADDPVAHFRAGKAYRKLKKYDQAIEEYQKAIEIKEDFAQAYSALGQIYLADEKFEEAIEAYLNSVHYNPKGYRSFFNLAVAIQSAHPDSLDASLAAWRQALRMARNNPRVTDIVPIAEIQITELEKQIALRAGAKKSTEDK